VPLALTLLLLL